MALDNLGLASVGYDGVDYGFHYFSMVAWMDRGLLQACVRVALHRYRFLSVVCGDIFEDLILGQRLTILGIAGKPQPWRLGIEIIGDTQVILSDLSNHILASLLLFFFRFRLREQVIVVTEIIQVKYLFFLWLSFTSYDLNLLPANVIDVHHLTFISFASIRVIGEHPPIFDIAF